MKKIVLQDRLKKKLHLWYKEVDARMSIDNPFYISPAKASPSDKQTII
ncbi:hypothetical protein [Bacteroides fragilis]|jgi:hypothetical protein|nr:hypothetical protein [Bacteroides fragilis]MCM0251364.1 hypothetical protein [Bacteroides fragilis]MCM0296232.1 hypothetical protein [Bacteroides fragilis]